MKKMYPFSRAATVGDCRSKQALFPSSTSLPSAQVAGHVQMGLSCRGPRAIGVSAKGPVFALKGDRCPVYQIFFLFTRKAKNLDICKNYPTTYKCQQWFEYLLQILSMAKKICGWLHLEAQQLPLGDLQCVKFTQHEICCRP